jgi:hypothetical protein
MSVESSIGHLKSTPERIPQQLGAARDALVDSQRELPRGSAAWRAMRAIIREIDALMPVVSKGQTQSGACHLNAHLGSHNKARTLGRREGAPIGWSMEAVATSKGSLESFAEGVLKKGRIGKYDVQLLRSDILVDGITSRAEAECLIELDRRVGSVHFSWSAFFIAAMTDFVAWQSGEAGTIDQDTSTWLRSTLAGDGATDRATRALVAIARDAECFDAAFVPGTICPSTPTEHVSNPGQPLGLAA